MRLNPNRMRLALGASAALTIIGLLLALAAFARKDSGFVPQLLLPHAPATTVASATPTPTPVSTHWIIKHFGQCCEGNLAAQGNSTYVLLPSS
jgi:hypothetical protein